MKCVDFSKSGIKYSSLLSVEPIGINRCTIISSANEHVYSLKDDDHA